MSVEVGNVWEPSSVRPDFVRLAAAGAMLFVGLPILAALYGVVTYVIPIIYLNIGAALLFAVLLGTAVGKTLSFGRIGSRALAMPIILLAPLFAHLFGWMVWVFVVLLHLSEAGIIEAVFTVLYPPAFFETVGEISRVGVWTIGRRGHSGNPAVTGTVLWVVWSIEALIVVGGGWVAGFVAHEDEARRPMCSSCGGYVEDEEDVLRLAATPEQALPLTERVRALDLAALDGPAPTGLGWLQIDLATCACKSVSLLSCAFVQVDFGRTDRAELLRYLGVGPEHVRYIRELAARVSAANAATFVSTPFGTSRGTATVEASQQEECHVEQ